MTAASQARGRFGEARAAQWYERAGYEIVDRNWRVAEGEIDLVVRRGDLVVFVEVKARASTRFGLPIEAITTAKSLRIRRLAAGWLRDHHCRAVTVRFDAVSVLGTTIEVVHGAF